MDVQNKSPEPSVVEQNKSPEPSVEVPVATGEQQDTELDGMMDEDMFDAELTQKLEV